MKIAFIGQKGIPAISGGVEKHVERLAVELARIGHDVVVYTRPHYTDSTLARYEGVRLVSLPSLHTKHLDAISHTRLATVHALFQGYDVIHYQSIGPSLLSFIPRLLTRRTRVVATFHSRDYFHQKWNRFARLSLRIAEWATCVFPEKTIVISETLHRYAQEAYGRDLVFIPNGADTPAAGNTDVLREYGLKEGRYVLNVGRFVRHKGVHYLIKAFQGLRDTASLPGNDFKLAIVGSSTKDTADYEAYLRFLGEKDASIVFLGERTGDDLAALFTHAAVFVQPSEDEGLSLALLEAMGYGLPTVVSDIPANVEAIADTGLSFENRNVADLKQKLATIVNTPAERARLGRAAKERAAREYAWGAIARRTAHLYETFLPATDTRKQQNYVPAIGK